MQPGRKALLPTVGSQGNKGNKATGVGVCQAVIIIIIPGLGADTVHVQYDWMMTDR